MGKVTALTCQKRNRDRVSVDLDGRFAFGLPAIVAASLKPGQILSDEEFEALRERGTVEEAYNSALNYLSYRPRSRAEVVTHLRRQGVPENRIESAAERLERAGLLGDEAFARYWVENRERFRPRGQAALRYELRCKGVSDDVINQALASFDSSESAYQAASRKAQQLSHLDRLVFTRKLVEYLGRRGFEYEVAKEAAERHWAEFTGGE
jgi:regulatory protein